jgi:4-amino-4-deoxy-L-arabinose transferase-like glycosyltransferase
MCLALATVNAWIWAVVTPSFQVPDEVTHSAYVQYLAETGNVPRPIDTRANGRFHLSEEETVAVDGVPLSYDGVPSWSPIRDAAIRRLLARPLDRVREAGAGPAANYPPLYYAVEAVPYRLAHSGSFFDRLLAMRLLSALFAGATAAFSFMFLRELLPGAPWAWRVGGIAVAFQPLLGFVSGGVNPDSLLWAASAAFLWLIARAFRRGLTTRVAVGIGVALAVALLTKSAAYALLPPAALALLALSRRGMARQALVAAAVALGPFIAWLAVSSLALHRGVGSAATVAPAHRTSLGGQLAYLWETFLPRLPGMPQEFHHYPTYPLWQDYFQGLVGRFGYAEYGFSQRVNWLALAIAVAILALAVAALARARPALARRRAELGTYALLVLTIVLGVAFAGYRFRTDTGVNFEQTRYLFPLLPLYGALFALAVRGARRYGRIVGVLLVVLVVAQNGFSLLLTLQRYYT